MKFQTCFIGFSLLALGGVATAADGIVTLTASHGVSNQVEITSSQSFKGVSFWDNCGSAIVRITKDSKAFYLPAANVGSMTVAGPAVISLALPEEAQSVCMAFVTLDIQPSPYPPSRAVTVGAYSGNVQVTMEMSTDLVNWTPAVNATVYTNSPDARFFRIKLVTNASP